MCVDHCHPGVGIKVATCDIIFKPIQCVRRLCVSAYAKSHALDIIFIHNTITVYTI